MTDDEIKARLHDPHGPDFAAYCHAVGLMVLTGKGSTSYVQRALGIGYNAAARMVEHMEDQGIMARPNEFGKREVLLRPGTAAEAERLREGIIATKLVADEWAIARTVGAPDVEHAKADALWKSLRRLRALADGSATHEIPEALVKGEAP